jgi:hypothetical protein
MISDAYVKAQKLAGTYNWKSRQGQRAIARGHGPERWAGGTGSGGSNPLHRPSDTSPSAAADALSADALSADALSADALSAYSRVSLPPRPDDEWEDIEEVPALAESPPATAPGTLQQLAETLGATGTRKPTGPRKTSANVV